MQCDLNIYREHYHKVEVDFVAYLNETLKKKVTSARIAESGSVSVSEHDYGHRWSGDYVKKFFYRLFLLEKWYRWHEKPVTFLTITTRQDIVIEEQIILLKKGFFMILKELRRKGVPCSYLAAMDFHKTGYGHYHVVFFHDVPYWFRVWIEEKWEHLNFGSREKGLLWKKKEQGEIAKIVNYLFKHSGKIFTGKNNPGWLRFHSVVWAMQHSRAADSDGTYDYPGVRLFSMSGDIAQVMKVPVVEGKCLVAKDGQVVRFRNEAFSEMDANALQEYLDWFEKLKY